MVSVESNNYLTTYAYSLWEKSGINASRETTKQNIIDQLFLLLKLNAPWMSWYYSFIEWAYPNWVGKRVEQALSAYKFDLIVSGKENTRLNLFSPKEKWFLDQKLAGIFKNILAKSNRQQLSLESKATRWHRKIQKYYQRRDLMIGNYILYRVGKRFPNYKRSINWLKQITENSIEYHCKQTFLNIKDDDIIKGLLRYLEGPIDSDSNIAKVSAKIGYYVIQEKAKTLFNGACSAIAGKARSIQRSIWKYRTPLPQNN